MFFFPSSTIVKNRETDDEDIVLKGDLEYKLRIKLIRYINVKLLNLFRKINRGVGQGHKKKKSIEVKTDRPSLSKSTRRKIFDLFFVSNDDNTSKMYIYETKLFTEKEPQ